jgi:serine protease Do
VSLGSGFIIDPEGYIVTNNHVIAEADEITVILQDDTELKATIVGRDSRTDIAILKVKTDKKLPAVEWGDSSSAKVGDWVIAIGNPFGLGGTVTAGIISARARDISRRVGGVGDYVDDFIQTDASINVGNSGGPMFDMTGRVIGVNTAILSPNGANIGIGFALPSEVAKPVVEQVRKLGHVRRGWIGVYIQKLEHDIAESLGLSSSKGALVGKVAAGGPAEKAGFEHGDVILTFDGHEINDPRKLTRLVGETPAGKKVPVKIWRHRKEMLLSVTVDDLKETGDTSSPSAGKADKATGKNTAKVLGMSLAPLAPENREQYGIKADVRGVLVTEVAPNSVAFRKGIRPGDVIMEAAQTPVNTPADVLKKVQDVKKEKGKSLLILLNRDDMLAYEALKLDGSADAED